MKVARKYFLLLILSLLPFGMYGQASDETYYERLYYTAKVWGHVKYYHTSMSGFSVDWDDVLLESLDQIKTASDNESFNNALLEMINQAGPMGAHSTPLPTVPDSLNNNSDMSWIYAPILSEQISAKLDTIKVRFRSQKNRYVGERWSSGPPSFSVDNKFYEIDGYPDENMRILALFRYWNIIHYFFPHKYIMDQEWDTTLIEFIPEIINAADALSYNLAFKELTTKIDDSHAFFSSSVYWEWHGLRYPPFQARYIEEQLVITKVLPGSEVSQGDIITMIDSEDIGEMRSRLRKYAHGSNQEYIERIIDNFVLYGPAGEFSLTVSNGNSEKTITSYRNNTNLGLLNSDDSPIWSQVMSSDGCHFGIVDMGRLETTHVASMFNDLWNSEAIIFDLRNYPNGTLWVIVNYLFKTAINMGNFTQPDFTYPGRLYWIYEYIGNGTSTPYDGKVIILFDERSLSQSEYTVMGLEQFPGSVKIGSTTAAADGTALRIYLPGRIQTNATFVGIYYPDYSPTQRIGIIPDIEVRPTIEGIRDLQDEVMNAALNCDVLEINSEHSDRGVIHVYPNPAIGQINYELSIELPGTFDINIYDILGRKILTVNHSGTSGIIDVTGLPSGVYFLQSNFYDITQTGKFVIIK